MTASFPNRNVVIASVQTGCAITPAHQSGVFPPDVRENGGELLEGDSFYNTDEEIIYFYYNEVWVPMGGPGLLGPIYVRLDELQYRIAELEGTGEMDSDE